MSPSRLRRRHSRGRWSLLLGWIAAALTLLAWPVTRLHEATVEHAVCAEHGEVVDVQGVEEHASAPLEGERWDSRGGSEAGHEHCPFLVLGQPSASPGEARPARTWLREAAPLRNPGSEQRLASVPLLCLAPKQSPPV